VAASAIDDDIMESLPVRSVITYVSAQSPTAVASRKVKVNLGNGERDQIS
jgi:hypothetical protein